MDLVLTRLFSMWNSEVWSLLSEFCSYNFKTLVRILKDFCLDLLFPLSCLVLNELGD